MVQAVAACQTVCSTWCFGWPCETLTSSYKWNSHWLILLPVWRQPFHRDCLNRARTRRRWSRLWSNPFRQNYLLLLNANTSLLTSSLSSPSLAALLFICIIPVTLRLITPPWFAYLCLKLRTDTNTNTVQQETNHRMLFMTWMNGIFLGFNHSRTDDAYSVLSTSPSPIPLLNPPHKPNTQVLGKWRPDFSSWSCYKQQLKEEEKKVLCVMFKWCEGR